MTDQNKADEQKLCPDCGEPSLSDADGVVQCTSCGYSEEDEWEGA